MLKKQRDFLRLWHAKEHGNGIRKNPFFFRAPPKKWLIITGIVLGIVGIIGGCIGTTYLSYFRITGITVQGATITRAEDIQQNAWETITTHSYPFIAKENVFLIRVQRIEQELMKRFALESAVVSRSGRTLNIALVEKVTTLALRTQEKTVFLDLSGTYIRDATAEESRAIDVRIGTAVPTEGEVIAPLHAEMPIILDTQTDPATSLPIQSVEHILALTSSLHNQGITVKTYTLNGVHAPFVRLDTNQPYSLFFDLNRPVNEQISALTTITSSPSFIPPAEYIDLRFGAYVYMK